MSKNNERATENELVEMYVKFWEPYAVRMAAKDVDVIERVSAWLPKIGGMTVEHVSPYELMLHRVPSARALEIRGIVKERVVDEFGWEEEPSNVVSIGVVTAEMSGDSPRRGLFFRKPRCMYTEKTPGFVRLDDGGLGLAALTDGAFRGGKVVLYLHGNDEDIFESRESLKPFMPPACNLALVAYTGYGLSFGDPWERGCYDSAHRLYDWVRDLGYRPEDILIVGYSLGSSVALELAQTCDSKAVLLLAPLYSGLQTLMDWHPEESIPPQPDHGPFPSNEMIKNVKCPIAVIHGDKDETCLCERGRSLYELAPNKAGFTLVPGAGHCDLLARLGPVRFREVVSGLFEMVKGDR